MFGTGAPDSGSELMHHQTVHFHFPNQGLDSPDIDQFLETVPQTCPYNRVLSKIGVFYIGVLDNILGFDQTIIIEV